MVNVPARSDRRTRRRRTIRPYRRPLDRRAIRRRRRIPAGIGLKASEVRGGGTKNNPLPELKAKQLDDDVTTAISEALLKPPKM